MRHKLLLFLLLPAQMAVAQYQVELSTEAYTDLSGATELTYDAAQGGYYHAVNITFPSFRRTGDFSLQPSIPSQGAYVTDQGYIAIYDKPLYKNTIVFHCLFNNKFAQVAGVTKVSAVLEGAVPNRVAKFQWKDLVYDGNTAQKANFQAWFHENTGNISYHYGPNTLPAAQDMYIGTIVLNEDFSLLLDQYSLKGTPASKETTTGYTNLTFPPVTGVPVNGSVITLKRHYVSVNNVQTASSIALYPNPAIDIVHIRLPQHQEAEITILNAGGSTVFNGKYNTLQIDLPVQQLSSGLYFIKIATGELVETRKLVINE